MTWGKCRNEFDMIGFVVLIYISVLKKAILIDSAYF